MTGSYHPNTATALLAAGAGVVLIALAALLGSGNRWTETFTSQGVLDATR